MRAVILGSTGQLGHELSSAAPKNAELQRFDRGELDITHEEAVRELLSRIKPDLVLNAAAYTAVDRAESESEAAHAVNVLGAGNVAQACVECDSRLVHFSTDFVFDGAANQAYRPDSPTGPLGVYGQTKLEGEQAVLAASPQDGIVIRTSWLYSSFGTNFVKTMLRLMAERDSLSVVGDQVGSPTWAHGLASVIWRVAETPASGGIYHWCDLGAISWFDFALGVQELGLELGLLDKAIPISKITSADYPTAARRPSFSVLDCSSTVESTGIGQQPWRANLRRMLEQVESI